MARKGIENLIPVTKRTKDEAREISRKGGIKSGETRKKQREFKEIAKHLLSMNMKHGGTDDIEELQNLAELKGKNLTVADAVIIAIAQNAMKGDIASANYLRDITGQKPKDETELQVTVNEGKLGSILKQLETDKKKVVAKDT